MVNSRTSKLDMAKMEREERARLRGTPVGAYYTDDEWNQVGTRSSRKSTLYAQIGKKIGAGDTETVIDAALLQLEPSNQRSWRRTLFLAEAAIQSYLSQSREVLAGSVLEAANSMPVKELAMEDDPQEAPFIQVQLFPWGPLPVINGLRCHQSAIFAQASRALAKAADSSTSIRRATSQLKFVYNLLDHVAKTARLPDYHCLDGGEMENRDLKLPTNAELRESVLVGHTQWHQFLADAELEPEDVANLLYVSPEAPNHAWHFLDYPCNHAPIVQVPDGFVIANVAGLPFAALQLVWETAYAEEREQFHSVVRADLDDEVERFFHRMGNEILWKGAAGMVAECDAQSGLLILPIADIQSHPKATKVSLDQRVKECLTHVPEQIKRCAVVLVDASLDRPSLTLNSKAVGDRFVGHATLNFEFLNPVLDQVGPDPLFFHYYAMDLLLFTNHFVGWEAMDPPEILADYIMRKGFPLPEPELSGHLIQIIAASYVHDQSERLARRRFFFHPIRQEWIGCTSRGTDQELGIYRSEDDPLLVVLTSTPKPLWIEPAGEKGSEKLHDLVPGIHDALSYWLGKWSEKLKGAPGWETFPEEGALIPLMVTDKCLIMDPRDWTETNRPPHASVSAGIGKHTNLLPGVIQLGSPDFLTKRVNDYEHFMATEFLYGLRRALGFPKDDRTLIQYTIDSQKSPFERRLLAGMTAVGHGLTPVPKAPNFCRWSNQNNKHIRSVMLLQLYGAGFPHEIKRKDASDFLEGFYVLLFNQLQGMIDAFGANDVVHSAYVMVEQMMYERERAKVMLTALSVNEEATSPAYEDAISIASFVDRSVTSGRWLVHLAGQVATDVGEMLPASDIDALLHLANLCQEVGVMRDAYAERQERSAYILHGEHAFQSKGQDYSIALRDANRLASEKESRWGGERIEEYWPDPKNEPEVKASELSEPGFAAAFEAEFGVSHNDFVHGMAMLAGALDESAGLTVETWDALIERTAKDVSLPTAAIASVASKFTQQASLDAGLPGSNGPWRPLLPNSLLQRPILRFPNDKVCVGPRLFDSSIHQFLLLCSEGLYPAVSPEMKRAMQKARNRHTKAFEEAVQKFIAKQPGWIAKTGFPAGSFGAPSKLGDFDVLAWHYTGLLVAIECKAYSIAMGPRRLASEWKEMSKGKGGKPGTLAKHQARVDWLTSNSSAVLDELGFPGKESEVFGAIVTEKHTPTRVWKKTAMPVLAFDELQMCLEDDVAPGDWRTAAEMSAED